MFLPTPPDIGHLVDHFATSVQLGADNITTQLQNLMVEPARSMAEGDFPADFLRAMMDAEAGPRKFTESMSKNLIRRTLEREPGPW